MSRLSCAQASGTVLLAGWWVVCLLCQGSPDTAHAHHAGPSDLDRGCLIVAEVSPFVASQLLAESRRCADDTDDPFLTASPSPVVVLGSVRPAVHPDVPSSLSAKPYQLHRVYRI